MKKNKEAANGFEGKDSIASHILAAENSLRPAMYLKGEPMADMNILDRMKYYGIPGASVAVINHGKIEWSKGFGVKDSGSNGPVTAETLFQAASVSKPLTGLATLRLVEAGTLELDAHVNDKLASWKIPDNDFTEKEQVTIRHLLTHSGGLTISGFPGYAASEQVPTLLQILDGEKPANTPPIRVDMIPGSQWRYSGGGFIVAQQLIEDVTGKHFQNYMKEAVLDPLGMAHSTFGQPLSPEKKGQAASAHGTDGKPVEGGGHVYPELAAAGLWTTPSDLCRFSIELQKSVAGESDKIISRQMATDMLTPGIGNWGLGVGLGAPTVEEKRTFSHGGGNRGFVCMLFAYIHKGQGAVVMTNSDNGNQLVMEILRSLSSVYGWGILQPKEVTLFKMAPEKLASYIGDFRSEDEPDVPILVSIENEQLHIKSTETGDWPLTPVSETEFVYLDGGTSLTFIKGPDGKYDRIERWGAALSRK